ncbi:MAG: chromosomal replication initiator DnaA [Pseudomonadota bacterium]
MAEQLALDFPCQTAFGEEDYFVSSANRFAVGLIENWAEWPDKRLVLLGERGSGKTHLARIWADRAGAVFLDIQTLDVSDGQLDLTHPVVLENLENLPRAQEQQMFHLLNLCAQADQFILLTGRGSVGNWGIQLPDLESRLRQITPAKIDAPDDDLLLAVMMKQFQDRQIALSPKVMGFLSKRMVRSFEAVSELVASLDHISLQEHSKITLDHAKRILAEMS